MIIDTLTDLEFSRLVTHVERAEIERKATVEITVREARWLIDEVGGEPDSLAARISELENEIEDLESERDALKEEINEQDDDHPSKKSAVNLSNFVRQRQ
jgi:Mg-chelatase subunit ChlI